MPRVRLARNVEVPVVPLSRLPPDNLSQQPVSKPFPYHPIRSKHKRGMSPEGSQISHLAVLAPLLHRAVHFHPPNLLHHAAGNRAVAPQGHRDRGRRPRREAERGPGHGPEGEGPEGAE